MKVKQTPDFLDRLRKARENLGKSKTYENAVELQKAKRQWEDFKHTLIHVVK